MAADRAAIATLTAPAATDGRGEVAVLNDPTSPNFVGFWSDDSGFEGSNVRVSSDDVAEGDGAVFDPFFWMPASRTIEVLLATGSNWAATLARRDKLFRAADAKTSDGSFVWTEADGVQRTIYFRLEGKPQGPDAERRVTIPITSADPFIWGPAQSGSISSGVDFTIANAGIRQSPNLQMTLTSPSDPLTIEHRGTGETVTLTGLSGGGTVTVDFLRHSITQGGVKKRGALQVPGSTWWRVLQGSNTIRVTGCGSSSTYTFRAAW